MLNQQARWGHITRIKVEEKPVMLPMPKWQGGGEYASGDSVEVWTLVCDCEFKWETERSKFPGPYTTRTCADMFEERRDICEYARAKSKGRPAGRPRIPGARGIAVNIYMPMSIYETLADLADTEKTSVSKIAVEILKSAAAERANLDSKSEKAEIASDEELVPVLDDEPTDY